VSAVEAHRVATLPAVSILFAAFLGYNPIQHLLGSKVLVSLSGHNHAVLTGRSFFPHLISAPFRTGLHEAFAFAIVACLIAAAASLLRGGRPRDVPLSPGLEAAGSTPPDRLAARDLRSGTPALTTAKEQRPAPHQITLEQGR
jgi:hypothetical protein